MGVMKKALQDKVEGRDSVQERFFSKNETKIKAPAPSVFNVDYEKLEKDRKRKEWEEYCTWNRGFF